MKDSTDIHGGLKQRIDWVSLCEMPFLTEERATPMHQTAAFFSLKHLSTRCKRNSWFGCNHAENMRAGTDSRR